MEKMLAGLSTRRYPVGLESVGRQVTERSSATSKSAVSRKFVAMTETAPLCHRCDRSRSQTRDSQNQAHTLAEQCRDILRWTEWSYLLIVDGWTEFIGPTTRRNSTRTEHAGAISRGADCGGRASRRERGCDVVG
jgi:hypothetical protein